MRREPLLLSDIVAAADAIAEFIVASSFEAFESSLLIRSAVVHQLTIIGEAVNHLSPELRSRRIAGILAKESDDPGRSCFLSTAGGRS
jgi:uncharacterized protein with HEPN domain